MDIDFQCIICAPPPFLCLLNLLETPTAKPETETTSNVDARAMARIHLGYFYLAALMVDSSDPSLKLEAAYTSYDYLSGWNSAWGLMKDVELITNKGSVYLFSTSQAEPWIERLGELEMSGLGDRTSEGFGQIQICNEFHNIFREKAV